MLRRDARTVRSMVRDGELDGGRQESGTWFVYTDQPPFATGAAPNLVDENARLRARAESADLRLLVLDWIERVTAVGHVLMQGLAMGLGLPPGWFREHLTADPVVLFRIFHYPPAEPGRFGVGEHTDAILAGLGLGADEVAALRERSAVG